MVDQVIWVLGILLSGVVFVVDVVVVDLPDLGGDLARSLAQLPSNSVLDDVVSEVLLVLGLIQHFVILLLHCGSQLRVDSLGGLLELSPD